MAFQIGGRCPACNGSHVFFCPAADLVEDDVEYEFRCPATQNIALVKFSEYALVTQVRAPGAVTIAAVR
jgi:hypothetical protein